MNFFGDVFNFLTSSDQWHGNESIPHLAGQQLQLTIVSVLVAAVIALPIGILLGHVRKGGTLAVNIANIGRALPAFALLILAVQWVGIGDPAGILTPVQSVPAFIAMFALALPPMLANAYVGIASVDDDLRDSARGMGMSGRQMIWRVELPNAVPLIMAGVRTAAVAVVATSTLAALVDSGGFGRYIIDGFAVQDNVKVFAGGLLVALLAIALELFLALVQRWLTSPGLRRERRATLADAVMDRMPGIDQAAL